MQETSDAQLLRDYAARGSEAAFRELVARHTDFIYSAALRQAGSPDLAGDITQGVFSDLARKARELAEKFPAEASLAGWLHRAARYAALNHLRDTRRRRENERQAMEQLLTNSEPAADWERIRPVLDEALDSLDDGDREALLLRYFQNRDFRAVGLALGVSGDTAQKRVSRAVERLREFFAQRGITVGASGLIVVISANAVQAAPAGLVATISTVALATGTTFTVTSTIPTIAMTTLQKITVTAALAAAVGVAVYEARQVAALHEQNQALQQQQTALAGQIEQLQRERDTAKQRLTSVSGELAAAKKSPSEVLRLRGQVGVLRQEKAEIGSKSALSKITADPESRKMMREQQKMGMSFLFTDLVKNLKLTPEQTGQFNDLMADGVMDGIDLITQALHDKPDSAQIDRMFAAQESALQEKVAALIGADGLAQYQKFSKDLLGTLTTAQFEGSLTGEKEAKADKKKQFLQAVQEETRAGLAALGLPAHYQPVPMLNFRNIASEEIAARNLKLLDDIYGRVATRANGFLNEEELKKLQEFRTKGQEANQMMLVMNRKLMAPIAP